MTIAVIGGHSCSPEIAKIAEAVGKEIGQMGATLVCGGLSGVMQAACKGAKSSDGKTIGILPGHDKAEANPYVDISIVLHADGIYNAHPSPAHFAGKDCTSGAL